MSSQFAAFQLLMLNKLRLLKSANPPSPRLPQPTIAPLTPTSTPMVTRPSTPIPTTTFRSLFAPLTTTYSGLGLSHPSSPSLAHLPPIYQPLVPLHHPSSLTVAQPHCSTTPPFFFLPPNPFSPSLSQPPSFHIIPSTAQIPPHPTQLITTTTYHQPSNFKAIKMELPRFNGDDLYGWLAVVERYLDYYEVPPHQCVLVAACNFGANASIWMRGFEQRYGHHN